MYATFHRRLRASAAALLLCGCHSQSSVVAPAGEVVGRYVNLDGTPSPSTTFQIDGRTALTDAAGYFRFSAVPASYDLMLVAGEREFTIYEGVTRRDPVVTYPSRYVPIDRWAEITGRVPHSTRPCMIVVSTTRGAASTTYVDSRTDAYFVNVSGGQATGPQWVTVQALLYTNNVAATRATRTVQVAPGTRVIVDFDALDFTPVATASVAVRVSLPDAADPVRIFGRAIVVGAPLPFFDGSLTNEAVLRFPRIPGLFVDVEVQSYSPGSGNTAISRLWGVPLETNPIEIALHHAPSQQAPADSAQVDWNTELSWSPGDAGGLFELRLQSTDGTAAMVTRYTNRVAIPLGEAVPSGFEPPPGGFSWRISQTYAAQSVDELLQAGRTFDGNAAFAATARSFTLAAPGAAHGLGAPAAAAGAAGPRPVDSPPPACYKPIATRVTGK